MNNDDATKAMSLRNLIFELSEQRARQDKLNQCFDQKVADEYADARRHLARSVIPDIEAHDVKETEDIAALLIYSISEIANGETERGMTALELILTALESAGVDVDALGADHHVPSRTSRLASCR